MSDLEKEFPGLLYNKLWENVIQKENRLWTFLSFYGAAVGVVIGTGVSDSSLKIEALFVILVLTYWAAELILDSDWWSVRNRMMIERIERSAQAHKIGWIPTFYRGARYASESIIRVCLCVFILIGLVTFWMAASQVSIHPDLSAAARATWICALYAASVSAVLRCAHVRETQIKNYYDTYMDLDQQTEPAAKRSSKEEGRDRRSRTGRAPTLLIVLALNAIIFASFQQEIVVVWPWFLVDNALLVLLFLSISIPYLRYSRNLSGKDAGFLLFDRDRITGKINFGECAPSRRWLIGNWILAVFFLVSTACLWFVVHAYSAGRAGGTYSPILWPAL